MRKDELIQMHSFLIHIKTSLEQLNDCDSSKIFTSYESLSVGPQDVHKSKEKQKHAVIELYKCISKELIEDEIIQVQKM